MLASHYPYAGDIQDSDRHTSHRPVDRGIPLLHGHTHDRGNGPVGHQFHVGVDAFDYAPIPFSLIDAWLADLRREDDKILRLVRERTGAGESRPLAELAAKFGVALAALDEPAHSLHQSLDVEETSER